MKLQNNSFLSIEQLQDQYLKQTKKAASVTAAEGFSFQEILEKQKADRKEIKFSKHALGRLHDRNITLSEAQMERLQEGTAKASEKGIKESLVLMDQMAFIVNIPNHTVVTAMSPKEANQNVFTNIDGAVII